MIKKLKLRYLITNMALLSGTLLIFLGVLFGVLYHSEVNTSYKVMQQMLADADMPRQQKDAPAPTGAVSYEEPELMLLDDVQETDPGSDQNNANPWQNNGQWSYNPWTYNPWMYNPWQYYYNPWANPWTYNQVPNDQNGSQENQDSGQNDSGWGNDQQPQWGWWIQTPEQNDGGSDVQAEQQPAQTEPSPGEYRYGYDPKYTAPHSNYSYGYNPYNPQYTGSYQEPKSFFSTTEPVKKQPDSQAAAQDQTEDIPPVDMPEPYSAFPDNNQEDDGQNIPPASAIVTSLPKPQTTEPETQTTAATVLPVKEGEYVPNALIAQMDENGNIASYAGVDTGADGFDSFKTVNKAMDQVRLFGASSGTLNIGTSYYRYLYQADNTGTFRLILLDRTLERSTISKLVFIFLLIGICGLLLMFGISWQLANWTVTPIATAWEKQKQFVADASHELKTPLAVISANTEVILSNPTASISGQTKWLNYIQSETMRMSKLVSNLLSIARMDHAQDAKNVGTLLSLSDTVSNVCLIFEPIIYENNKTLNTVIQRKVMLRAEEDDLKQLLSILLDNAVLHSVPKAQITVSLSKDTQGKIRLAVSNTAKDIPPEQLSHLFDRFYRVDTEGSPNGSGLGLSIAKSIVTQMGGKISVSSENQLVTFTAVFST